MLSFIRPDIFNDPEGLLHTYFRAYTINQTAISELLTASKSEKVLGVQFYWAKQPLSIF